MKTTISKASATARRPARRTGPSATDKVRRADSRVITTGAVAAEVQRADGPVSEPVAAAASAFELSRIYASGWLAGSRHEATDSLAEVCAGAAALNPRRVEAERLRWEQGFTDAVHRRLRKTARTGPQFKPGAND